jgi:competence protein ComEC
MGLICMAGLALGRLSYSLRALAVATLAMLIYEPRNLFDISFQLSVGCTAGLLYFYPQLVAMMKGLLPDWAVTGVAATLAAQLGVMPFLSWYFGSFPLISLAANLLVVPILEAVILIGLAGTILAGSFDSVARLIFVGISLLLGMAVEVNRFLSRMPGGTFSLPAMGLMAGGMYYAILFWLFGAWEKWGLASADLRRQCDKHPAVSAGIALFLMSIVVWNVIQPGLLQVHFIDVGQGDATLIITPSGRAVLVDAGGAVGPQNDFDVGEQVVVPYLRHYGVKSVDWLILTHNHQDHAGGAAAVARFVGIHQALIQPSEAEIPTAVLRLKQVIKQTQIQAPEGISEIRLDGVKLQLFQIGDRQETRTAKRTGSASSSSSENERSTVVRLEYGQHSFLLTGDLEGDSEKKIRQMGLPVSTVLKVGHHGSRKSSQPEFLNNVSPSFAVVSVGGGNQFGHPAPETVRRLLDRPLALFRTDRDGAIVFRSNRKTLTVERTVQ